MKLKYLLAASVVSLTAATTIATPAVAQQITTGVEGRITDENGNAISGAAVTVTNTATNATRTTTTGSDGNFRVTALQPGGPYEITVIADGFEGQTVQDVFTNIGGRTAFTFALTSTEGSATGNTIVVSGARASVSQLAVGPGTAFGQAEITAFPSITRDVRDIIRIDPRVNLERGNNDNSRVSCLGGSDRSNTFTVDGIVQADVFGLNGTPFAAREALPIPFDVVDQVSVEFAPFDVEYSEFTGCLINVVTKAGSNKFSGSAFITYFDQGLLADEVDGRPLQAGSEKRWGATLSGPIIKDRLFFSFGYEETDLGEGNNFGPAGGGFANEANFATIDQFNEFARIANDVYGQDVGGFPGTLPAGSVRYFGRLDAQITDRHRLEGTYQRLDESSIGPDTANRNLTGLNSFNNSGTLSDYYSARLYSQWSDNISTELRVSRAEVGDLQGPVGFNEAQEEDPTVRLVVGLTPIAGQTTQNGFLSTGPGIFRSANQLNTKIDQARFQMNIDAGNGHNFKIGAEINDLEVFNLFARNATGSLYFENLADFEAGLLATGTTLGQDADRLVDGRNVAADIESSIGGDINNAAAQFSRTIYSFYAQDEWQASSQLAINAGVRVQLYDGDGPRPNPNFLARYGITNGFTFAGINPVVLPRVSATYEFDNEGFFSSSRLTGGVGIFSGGDPVVWFSNAFSNNGSNVAVGSTNNCAPGQLTVDPATGQISVLSGGQFTGFPQCAVNAAAAVAEQSLGNTQSTDLNFKAPTVTRANIGFQTTFGSEGGFFSNWRLGLDYIYSRFNNTPTFVDLAQAPNPALGLNGFTVDGRPINQRLDTQRPGCNAQLQNGGGSPPVFANISAACFGGNRFDEIQLTNGPSFESHVFSAILTKNFQSGLFTSGGGTRINIGYAFTDSDNNRDNTSSQSTSNYDGTAAFNRQNPDVSRSNFETRHNITAAINFREEFVDGYDTSFGFFFRARSGLPYSLVFQNNGVFSDAQSGGSNALIYVPTGPNDPNLSPQSNAQSVASLIDYVGSTNCGFTPGASIERNTCTNDWYFDLDLRFSQELPFLGSLTGVAEDRITVFADFDNFLNLLDSSWNVLRARSNRVAVARGRVDNQGRYIIDQFNPNDQNFLQIPSSAWRIQIGARYEF